MSTKRVKEWPEPSDPPEPESQSDAGLGPVRVGPLEITSKCEGAWPPITARVTKASNGDPECFDIILEQGDTVLEHHRDLPGTLDHPDVPEWLKHAAEKEIRELEGIQLADLPEAEQKRIVRGYIQIIIAFCEERFDTPREAAEFLEQAFDMEPAWKAIVREYQEKP